MLCYLFTAVLPQVIQQPTRIGQPHCNHLKVIMLLLYPNTNSSTELSSIQLSKRINNNNNNNFIIIFLVPKAPPIPRARKKNWLENVNAGMTISPGGLPPQNCCGAR